MRRAIAMILAALATAGCETLDLSETAETMERSQCRAEADRYPGALEDCEDIGPRP